MSGASGSAPLPSLLGPPSVGVTGVSVPVAGRTPSLVCVLTGERTSVPCNNQALEPPRSTRVFMARFSCSEKSSDGRGPADTCPAHRPAAPVPVSYTLPSGSVTRSEVASMEELSTWKGCSAWMPGAGDVTTSGRDPSLAC